MRINSKPALLRNLPKTFTLQIIKKTSLQYSPTQEHLFPFINQSNQKAQWDVPLDLGGETSILPQDEKSIKIDLTTQ